MFQTLSDHVASPAAIGQLETVEVATRTSGKRSFAHSVLGERRLLTSGTVRDHNAHRRIDTAEGMERTHRSLWI